jgi:predicted MFS family arabinose efflux permease
VGRAAAGPTQLRQVFSWLAIGPAFSNFLGPFSTGLAIDYGGFRLAFLIVAALPLIAWFWVRDVRELPEAAPHKGRPQPAWDLLREPMFRRLLLVNWLLSSCWDVHTFVVPVLGHERGLSASVIGTILGGFAIAAAAVRVVLPAIAARLQEWLVIALSMGATTVLFAVYPLLHSALAMGLCSVLLGIALGTVQPMVMSTLHQITPEHRHGQAVGLRLMAINASSVTMPMLFGAAGAVIGIAGVFWTVAGVVGGGLRLAWSLRAAAPHRE